MTLRRSVLIGRHGARRGDGGELFIGQRADIEAEAVVFDAAKNAGGIEPQPPRQFRGAYSRQGNGDDKTGNRLGWQGTAAEECLAFCDGNRGGWNVTGNQERKFGGAQLQRVHRRAHHAVERVLA